MQRANCTVRLGGLMTNTVPKMGVTPAEILVLQHIHGADAVVDIRPTEFDKRVRQEAEYDRLAATYDTAAGAFTGAPDEERKSIMSTLFPGALKRLPMTLEEIGIDSGAAAAAPEPEVEPDLPEEPEQSEQPEADEDDAAIEPGAEAPAPEVE